MVQITNECGPQDVLSVRLCGMFQTWPYNLEM